MASLCRWLATLCVRAQPGGSALGCFAALVLAFVGGAPAMAQTLPPAPSLPSVTVGTNAPLVDPGTAYTYYSGLGLASSPRASDPDITDLARSLRNDPDIIYQWVRDNVDVTYLFGVQNGARGARFDKWGTPFDQAQLMAELLRASGYSTNYVLGTITVSGAQFANWYGVSDATAASTMLANGGIPGSVASSGSSITSVTMMHIWVQTTIGATTYAFDPSFKSYATTTGINIAGATSFNGPALVSQALSGATTQPASGSTPAGVRAVNVANIWSNLSGSSSSLLDYLRVSAPTASIDNVVGARHIIAGSTSPLRQTSLPYQTSVLATFSGDIPTAFKTQLTETDFSVTLNADDIYAKLLMINGYGLSLDDQALASGTIPPAYANTVVPFTFQINHPYAANSGSYMDRTVVFNLSATQGPQAAVVFALGHGTPELGSILGRKIGEGASYETQVCKGGAPPDCNLITTYSPIYDNTEVKSATSWFSQFSRASQIYEQMGGVVNQHHHSLIVASSIYTLNTNPLQGAGPIAASMKMNIDTELSVASQTDSANGRLAALSALTATANILEGSVIEQTNLTHTPVSVAAKLDWLSRAPPTGSGQGSSDWIYYADANSWPTVSASLLADYSGTALVQTQAQAYINNGYSIVVPRSSNLGPAIFYGGFVNTNGYTAGPDQGGAIIAYSLDNSSIAYTVVRNTSVEKGGGGGVDTSWKQVAAPDANFLDRQYATKLKLADVDLQSGQLTYTPPPDLKVGVGDFPYSLTFQRAFQPGWGGGWLHNWMSNLSVTGDGFAAMGDHDARAATDTLALFQALLYLSPQSQPDNLTKLENHVISNLAAFWWAERLAINNVTVQEGPQSRQYVRLADGSFDGPPGDPSVLGVNITRNFINTTPQTLGGEWYTSPPIDYIDVAALSATCTAGSTSTPAFPITLTEKEGTVETFNFLCNPQPGSGFGQRDVYRRTKITTPSGVVVNITHTPNAADDSYYVSSVQNSLGRSIQISLTNGGGAVVSNPDDTTGATAVTFNGYVCNTYVEPGFGACQGQIASVTDPLNHTTSNNYAAPTTGRPFPVELTSVLLPTDTSTPTMTLAYDTQWRAKSMVDGLNRTTNYLIGGGRRGEILDPTNAYNTAIWNDLGLAIESIDPLGRLTTRQYDGRRRVILMTAPEGDSVVQAYDERSNVTDYIQDPKPGFPNLQPIHTHLDYKEGTGVQFCVHPVTCNQPIDLIDPLSNESHFTWDPNTGALTQALGPPVSNGTPETDYGYLPFTGSDGAPFTLLGSISQRVSATPTSLVTNFVYNNAAAKFTLLTKTVDPTGLNLVTTYTYDPIGNPTAVDGPRTDVVDITNYTWDLNRRLIFEIQPDPDGAGPLPRIAVKATVDTDGRLIQTDKGPTTSSTGLDFGMVGPLETTTYTYDAAWNKVVETTPARVTQFSYDGDDRTLCTAVRMNAETLPPSACTLLTGANGPDRIIQLTYDAAGQKLVETRALGTSIAEPYATYTYGLDGEQLTVADANSNVTNLCYDGFNRLSMMIFPNPPTICPTNGVNPHDYEAYAYDADNNHLSVQKRDGQVITFTYDALNREIVKHWPTGGGASDVYSGYDLLNHQLYADYGSVGGPGVAYTYDVAGRMLTETTNAGQLSYIYDQAGNRTQLTWPDGFNVAYGYDAMNRMTTIQDNSGGGQAASISYTFDNLSRRSGVIRGNNTTTAYGYDTADRLTSLAQTLSGAGNVVLGFTYIPSDQITARAISNDAYTWTPTTTNARYAVNGLNQYTNVANASLTYDGRGNLISDGTRTFSYDVENRLLSETGGPTALTLNYDPRGRLQQQTANGAATQFLYAGDELVAECSGTPCNSSTVLRHYVHGADTDEPVIWYEGSGYTDRRWLHEDNQGSVIAYTDDTGTAHATYTYGAYGEPSTWSGSRFSYTGQIMLPEAKLYNYKARVYDPILGRFLQTDPAGYQDDMNAYEYVRSDPIRFIDPLGLQVEIRLEGYTLRGLGGLVARHSYERATDTKTGESIIFRGGPLPAYPGDPIDATRGRGFPGDAQGHGRSMLFNEVDPAAASIDSKEALQRGIKPELLQSTTVDDSFSTIKAELDAIANSLNRSDLVYQPGYVDSNFSSAVAYQITTGQAVAHNIFYRGADLAPRPNKNDSQPKSSHPEPGKGCPPAEPGLSCGGTVQIWN